MARKRGKRSKRGGGKPRNSRRRGPSRKGTGIVRIRSMPRGAGGMASYNLACSVTDPWSCSACIPDGASGTGCFSVKQLSQLSTGTGGSCCSFFWNPSMGAQFISDSASTAATPTIPGTYSPPTAGATISSLYKSYRAVSAGIRATFVGNTLNDQGILLIGQYPAETAISGAFNGMTLTQVQAVMQNYAVYPLRSGGQVTWRPETMNDQDTFYITTNTGNATSAQLAQPGLAVIVYGATALASTLMVDAVVNYQGQYASQTFMPGGLTEAAAPAESGWFEKAKNMYNSVSPLIPFAANAIGTYLNRPGVGALLGGVAQVFSKSGLPVSDSSYRGRITEM